ncbi:MAG: ribonucleoside triphosphate reductase [Bacilli bacterium]|nr:ribonucleoside triphosphate reductase [Bacilli bacterium]
MLKSVIKRTGRKEDFNKAKIENAIYKAIINTRENLSSEKAAEMSKLTTNIVVFKLTEQKNAIVHLEDIQNVVEETLMMLGMTDVARSYVRYRFQREQIRKDMTTILNVENIMKNYIKEEDWLVKENANMDYSLQGLNTYIAGEITKSFWLNHVYAPGQKEAHENGDIHIHDLTMLSAYCCGWDMESLLLKGFAGVKNKVHTKPPKHLSAALLQIVNFCYTVQHESAGAQALSSIDIYLAPFIRYDNLSYKEVKQNMQMFIFNLNVPTRVGFQTPFTNVTLDLVVPSILKDKPVIIGGKLMKETYSEFQEEIDMFNKAFCEVMTEGDARGRTFTFPIPTYNITKDFDWDNPIVDDIMKMTSKYGIPYFANFINSDLKPEDARSMCCRLRLDNRELRKRGGGLFGANPLTGSIGVVTINLPRLGYLYKTKKDLKKHLRRLMDVARQSLVIKRKLIEKNTKNDLYPYSKAYLLEVYERFGEYWKNHFNTIGIVGMNECIKNFYDDKEDITTEVGQKFAKEILDYMREVIVEYQEDGNLYNLEATPAEGTSYRLARADRERYPDIITAGKDEPYYTNSTHLPVDYTTDLYEVLRLQNELQTKYTGGTVLHAYIGEQIDDYRVTKNLIKKVFENYELPYFSITPTFSICDEHGYLNGEQFKCPKCNKDTEVWTRVVGFYRPVQAFNKGKREEYHDRLTYNVE